jgi:Uma2 family endonuclease
MNALLSTPFESTQFCEPVFPVRRFTVDEYMRLGDAGILTEDDRVELLEGFIVQKMPRIPRHDATIDILGGLLHRLLPAGWYARDQKVLLTSDSAPEPDMAIVLGEPRDYWKKHPTGKDAVLVIEVSESSLDRDRRKQRIYARAGIRQYWILDLSANQIEMYAEPDAARGEYQQKKVVGLNAPIALTLSDDTTITLPLDTALKFT